MLAFCSGYFDKLEELSELAESVSDSDNIYFKSGLLHSHFNVRKYLRNAELLCIKLITFL